MDAERFDDLTRTLAASASRRTALKTLVAALVAGALSRASSARAQTDQTLLKVTNSSGSDVQAYLTLGAVPGCVQDVRQVSWGITVTDTVRNLQGSFMLANGQSVTYTPPAGMGISGNVSFGTPPQNCPPAGFPNGVNLAEFILNNGFQGAGAQETIDDSGVDGVNATIRFSMSGGGAWNGGPGNPNITSFQNKGLRDNTGIVGVFPWGCTNCVDRAGAPSCQTYEGTCNPTNICNVQRDASSSGGTVEITFSGFIGTQAGAHKDNPTQIPLGTPLAPLGSESCGGLGNPCCAGNTCTAKNTMCGGGSCISCGTPHGPCCPGNTCLSGPCNNGICADPTASSCGAVGQPCCLPGNTCDDTSLACISGLCVTQLRG